MSCSDTHTARNSPNTPWETGHVKSDVDDTAINMSPSDIVATDELRPSSWWWNRDGRCEYVHHAIAVDHLRVRDVNV